MIIRIDPHTIRRASERGANKKEIRDVIETGFVIPAKYGKRGKAKIYKFNKQRQGKHYIEKRVEVFYAIESNFITTITVYVFYGKWEV